MATNNLGYPRSKRQLIEKLRSQLELERSSFLPHWKDLSNYILPRRARFNVSDVNKGDRRNQKINDTTGTMAARTLRSGLMGGVTSPARPWFKLTLGDPDLAEYGAVREYLHRCQTIMSNTFLRCNLYNTLPLVYGDLGTFATAPMSCLESFDKRVMHTMSFPIGSYMIAKDFNGRVNTYIRDFQMTVGQLVDTFGKKDDSGRPDWSVFSNMVKTHYERGEYNTWVQVCHTIMPNAEYDPKKLDSKFKRFASVYFERGQRGGSALNYTDNLNEDRFLEEKGFDIFPILCPRWEVTGEDVYGTDCPGMTALSDIKSLQLGERRSFQAIEKMIDPPMMGPTSLRNSAVSFLPGDINYVSDREAGQGLRPVYQLQFDINALEMKQNQTRQRIQRAYYEDLFLMLANDDRSNITAEEIRGKKEERLLALGPVLEQLNQDLLDPLIDLSFEYHNRQGLLPPPPEELQGMDLKVEYISVMAQAQKLVGIGGADRFLGTVGQIAQYDQSVIQKVKADRVLDDYADMLSIPPSWVRTEEEMKAIQAQQAQQQAAQAQMQQLQQASLAAKNLAQAPLDGNSALNGVLQQATAGQ